MNQQMIRAWNAVVNERDTVYHLGDVAMHPKYEKGFPEILEQLVQLNGRIIFIKGNHDSRTFLIIWRLMIQSLRMGKTNLSFTMWARS